MAEKKVEEEEEMNLEEARAEAKRRWPAIKLPNGSWSEGWAQESGNLKSVGVRHINCKTDVRQYFYTIAYGMDFEDVFKIAGERNEVDSMEFV